MYEKKNSLHEADRNNKQEGVRRGGKKEIKKTEIKD